MPNAALPIRAVTARVYSIPTDAPEADGTIEWDRTTLLVVWISAADGIGLGYSYAAAGAASVVRDVLAPVLLGEHAFAIPGHWAAMVRAVRNIGWRGIAAGAISAVDVALWDLKAQLLGVSLLHLFGACRASVPIYGSGGFTSYPDDRLADQLKGWIHELGCRSVKMKIGIDADRTLERISIARAAVGPGAELMIDANGALDRKRALAVAERAVDLGVTWFEEPVSSDDLDGLRMLRDRAPAGLEVAAGEYGYEPFYFRRMLDAQAVDVLQADATRCCGYTGFLTAAALAEAAPVPLSAHTAPALHLPVCCAVRGLRHIEWFHDHARLEAMLFDGAPVRRAVRPRHRTHADRADQNRVHDRAGP